MRALALISLLSTTLLCACIGGGQTTNLERYSMLEDSLPSAFSSDYDVDISLYRVLNEGGIVVRTSQVGLRPASNHRWADDLGFQLQVLFTQALQQATIDKGLSFKLNVSKFYGSLEGSVEVALLLQCLQADKLIFEKDYYYQGQQQEQGYDKLVEQLKWGFNQLSQQMASDLKALKKKNK